MSGSKPKRSVHDFTRAELAQALQEREISPVHAATLWNGLYLGLAESWDAIEALPARVRRQLAGEFAIAPAVVVRAERSTDGFTRKFLLGLEDGERIETVLMKFTGRVTACVSSQVGCAMGCVFCATGQMGYTRNLSAGEIVAQAVHVARELRHGLPPVYHVLREKPAEPRLRNIVLMGMGEPLHNYDEVMRAVDILRDSNGLAIAGGRITLSTVGVVPGIRRLAEENRPVSLAVSLHAATQAERAALVPVARKWPLEELMAACRDYSARTGRRIFYEWTLIEGRNDSEADARAVGMLLRGMPAQVNLIPLNPTAGYVGAPSRSEAAKRFQQILADEFSLPSTVRQRRGIDIAAGCGQLAST